jgi:hypothetical protein
VTEKKLATKHQMARLMQMFASNQLPFEETQALIDAHKAPRDLKEAAV